MQPIILTTSLEDLTERRLAWTPILDSDLGATADVKEKQAQISQNPLSLSLSLHDVTLEN